MPRHVSLAPALLLALLAGCASGSAGRGGAADPFSGTVQRPGSITVLVDNDNRVTAAITVVSPGGSAALGRVAPGETELLSWSASGDEEVRMVIELRTGESHRTEPVRAAPGDQLRLTVGSLLTNSRLRR